METLEQLSHSTIRINCIKEVKNDSGKIIKFRSRGTGFFYELRVGDKIHDVLVTNKHVIKNAVEGELVFTLKGEDGKPVYSEQRTFKVKNFKNDFLMHPDPNVDLCIMPMGKILTGLKLNKLKAFYLKVPESFLPEKDAWDKLIQGNEVIMVGYPKGLIDEANNAPIMRSGITSTAPRLNYRGKEEFLIDMPVYKGSSGSPVFIKNPKVKTEKIEKGTRIRNYFDYKLIGIVYATPVYKLTDGSTKIEILPIEEMETKTKSEIKLPMNLGVVIKSHQLEVFKSMIK